MPVPEGSGVATAGAADGSVEIILMFGPVSGAHFKRAVTFAFPLRRELAPGVAAALAAPGLLAVQLIGAVLATWLFGWLLRPGTDAVPAKSPVRDRITDAPRPLQQAVQQRK